MLPTLTPIATQLAATPTGPLEYAVAGAGTPAGVLINGAGGPLAGWGALFNELAPDTRVFAYNRPGIGRSAAPDRAQDGAAVVAALRDLLAAVGVAPPYLLVGHSLGGLHAQLFARLHPAEVAGVVFLEASHPADLALDDLQPAPVRALNRLLRGLDGLSARGRLAEVRHVQATADQLAAAPAFPPVPLVVVSGGARPFMMPAQAFAVRSANQRALVGLAPGGEQVVAAASGHFPQLTEPAVVLAAIRGCLARARGDAPP